MREVRSSEEVEQLKQKILTTALDLIIEEGFSAFSMRRLARNSGMTAPNIYNYFKNKDEIYITLMIQGFHRLYQFLEAAASQGHDPVHRARLLIHAYLEFALDQAHYYELMFSVHAPKYLDFQGTTMEPLSQREHSLSMEVVTFADDCLVELINFLGHPFSERQRRHLLIELWSLLHGLAGLHLTGNSVYLVERPLDVYTQVLDDYLTNWIERIKQG